jgi:hypothetical protein
MKTEGGTKQFIQIERLKCTHCERLHNALPDFLVPHKHYAAQIISGVLDQVISTDDLDAEDYPCEQTMKRWHRWFNGNQNNIEGNLRSIGYRLLGLGEDLLSARISLLTHLRKSSEVWLETILRMIYNSGSFLVPV